MALTAAQLADLVTKTKMYLRKSDDDASILQEGFTIFHDESASATAATVGISGTTLTLIITGGSNAGTRTIDLTAAAYDTLTELVNALPDEGWVGDVVGDGDASSSTLRPVNTVSAFGFSNMQTLRYTDDSLFELLVQQCFDAIETACDRSFFSADYDERVFTYGQRRLLLQQPDVQRVTYLGLQTFDAMRISYDGSGQRASVEVTDTMLRLVERTGGTDTATTYTFSSADFDTVGELVTAIDALSAWSSVLVNDGPSKFLIRRPAVAIKTVVGTQNLTLESWQEEDNVYDLDYESGQVWLSHVAPYGIARVLYTAGFDTLPTPVERELLRMVKTQYEALGMNSAASRMKLGDYEIQSTGISIRTALDAEEVATRLARYRRALP